MQTWRLLSAAWFPIAAFLPGSPRRCARDPEHLARLQRALDMRGSIERSSIEFAVRHFSAFTIPSPAAVLSITRSRRRMDIAARTECQMGILSDYGNYSL